jgi:hypothetical protein
MLLALGAASSAIDALKALMSSKSSSTQPGGPGQGATGPFDFSAGTSAPTSASTNAGFGGSVGPQISPDTMSALLAAQGQSINAGSSAPTSRADALKDLFSRIDADGDDKITNRNSNTRSAPAAPTSCRPTMFSESSTRTATAR